jgi:hypothetical protein
MRFRRASRDGMCQDTRAENIVCSPEQNEKNALPQRQTRSQYWKTEGESCLTFLLPMTFWRVVSCLVLLQFPCDEDASPYERLS